MTGYPKGKEPSRSSDPFVTVSLKSTVPKKTKDVGMDNIDKILLELVLLDQRLSPDPLDAVVVVLPEVLIITVLVDKDVRAQRNDHHPGHLVIEAVLVVQESIGRLQRIVFVLIS